MVHVNAPNYRKFYIRGRPLIEAALKYKPHLVPLDLNYKPPSNNSRTYIEISVFYSNMSWFHVKMTIFPLIWSIFLKNV